MPTKDQVLFHNQQEAQRRAQEAAIAQQASAQQAQQQYGIQSALSAQGANQQAQLASHHVDLQARLQEVTLNQQEQMRLQRMHAGRAAIEDNADLAPSERRMLITQLESGINPLENRQRESQMISAHLQQQGLAQQTQQQATLFNQRQERLAAGAQGRQQVFTDPVTGQRQLFQMDLEGNWQALDFGLANERHLAQMQTMQSQLESQQQQREQSADLHPGAVQRQDLGNQQLAQTMQFAREIHPLDVRRATQANTILAQQIEQNPQQFQMNQMTGYAHLEGLQQQLAQRIEEQPHHLGLLQANAQIAQARAAAEPQNTALAQQAQQATIAHTNAATAHTNAIVERMPSVSQAATQHGAQSQHAQDTATLARINLQRLQAGGMSDANARDIVDHAIGGVDREIAHAQTEVQRMAASALTSPDDLRVARERLTHLQQSRATRINQRSAEAEGLIRRINGMPPGNQPGPAPEVNPQAGNVFQGLEQQVAALPPAQRQVVAPAVARLQALQQAYPGGFPTMPRDIQVEVMRLFEQVRGAAPAGAGEPGQARPPEPGFFQRINERFGGG